jgi:hypothetical protein
VKVLIGFSTSSWWVSRVIKFFTRAPVSHTFVVFDDMRDADHEIYEAAWCGWRMTTRAKLTLGTTVIVKEITVDVDPVKALGICRAWLETPYSYLGLLGELPVQIGLWLGQRWRNPARDAHHMYCSEAGTRLLQMLGFAAVTGLDAVSTNPYQLDEALTPAAGEGGAVGVPLKQAEKVVTQ